MTSKDFREETSTRKMAAGIREEEACEILNLRKTLDYSEVLIHYAGKYLRMGWELLAVNFQGDPTLELDFKQSQEVWAQRLTGLGLEGIQVNLGVRTGAPSRLLVLEVHREESLSPFDQRGEWCSGCVAEVGLEREQHYYALPKGWQPPASYFMESCQVMVFGEGGVILAPPSLEPRAQNNLRWLRPPWESPPTRPSPGLCKFIKEQAPTLPQPTRKAEPPVMAWGEIYPVISSHPEVLQALLAPAATSEGYYQHLLRTAKAADLEDPQMLLGLLWHAPLGNSHHHPRRAEYLMGLVKQTLAGIETGELPKLDGEWGPSTPGERAICPDSQQQSPPPPPSLGEFTPPVPGMPAERPEPSEALSPRNVRTGNPGWNEIQEAWSEMWRFSHENLVVERRRYEAMIYELGKLGALNDYFKREHRQNKVLKEKLETQWTKELDHLRQLVAKKTKKGWYRSWRQE
jgi:hypothetical protein